MQLQSNIGEEVTSKRKKKGSGSDTRANPQMYLLLENLVWRYRRPCVLDLKVHARCNITPVTGSQKPLIINSIYSKFVCPKLLSIQTTCTLSLTGRLAAVRGRQQRLEEAAEDGEGGGDHLGHARPQGLRHAGKQGKSPLGSSECDTLKVVCSQGKPKLRVFLVLT